MKLTVIGDRVLIKPDAAERVSKGGIVMPVDPKEHEQLKWGEVLAVGDGHLLENGQLYPLRVKAGDRVLFNVHFDGGAKVSLPDQGACFVMKEGDILGVVRPA